MSKYLKSLLPVLAATFAVALPAAAATVTVTSVQDSGSPGDGACTLREAIVNANVNADRTDGDCAAGDSPPFVDRILFDLPGAAPHAIRLVAPLPAIGDPVVVDGLSQPAGTLVPSCRRGPLLVVLDGCGQVGTGLELGGSTSSGSTIRGLVFQDFTEQAILLATSNDNRLSCNFIGTDAFGREPRGNADGIRLRTGARDNVLGTDGDGRDDLDEGNLISGNTRRNGIGVHLTGVGTTGNRIAGNRIGTDVTGLRALGNHVGVWIRSEADANIVGTDGNLRGDAFEGNIVSGHVGGRGWGVAVTDPGVVGNRIAGNKIGTDAAGTGAVANRIGVLVGEGAAETLVGTDGDGLADALERNLISGNQVPGGNPATDGVGVVVTGPRVDGPPTRGTHIAGNWIGVDTTGLERLGNGLGMRLERGAEATVVGAIGDGPGGGTDGDAVRGNVIAGQVNGPGILAFTDGLRVAGNRLGTDAAGRRALGGAIGLRLEGARDAVVRDNLISGHTTSSRSGQGLWIRGGSGHVVLGNRFGTDAAGRRPIANDTGLRVDGAARDHRLGADGEGNLLAGNRNGLVVAGEARGIDVRGNLIGVAPDSDGVARANASGVILLDTSESTVRGNRILGNSTAGLTLDDTATLADGSHDNCFGDNGNGVVHEAAGTVDLTNNWWGDPRGPARSEPGVRDEPFLTTAPPGCPTTARGLAPAFRQAFVSPSPLPGRRVTLELEIASARAASEVTGLAFAVDLAAALPGLSPLGLPRTEVCGEGSRLLAAAGGFRLQGGELPAGVSSCTVRLELEVPAGTAPGTYTLPPTRLASRVDGTLRSSQAAPAELGVADGAGALVVTTVRDDSLPADGLCSLREAISNANTNFENTGGDCARGRPLPEVDRIVFDIPGPGPHWLRPEEDLPPVMETMVIDGLSQPSHGGDPASCVEGPLLIVLDGRNQVENGLLVLNPGADGTTIRGLVFARFLRSGVRVAAADDTRLQCNFFGTNPSGTSALGNRFGIEVSTGGDRNVIGTDGDGLNDAAEGNLISGNTASNGYGIFIRNPLTEDNRIAGNRIGTDVTGTVALGNRVGIRIRDGVARTVVGTNGDGVSDALEGNLISGNDLDLGYGVFISDRGTDDTWIAGNRIGTDAAGLAPVPNRIGVRLSLGAQRTLIGTDSDGLSDTLERNLLSGNTEDLGYAVRISDADTDATRISGNWIGVDAAGTAALANRVGVRIEDGARNTLVGTDGDGNRDEIEGNVISGQELELGYGVYVSEAETRGTVIAGNKIGTDPTGAFAIPNIAGVRLRAGARETTVGTDSDGVADFAEGNLISGNTVEFGYGVYISTPETVDNRIAGNWIGVDVTGNVKLPNNVGVRLSQATRQNVIGTDGDGILDGVEGNIISGNTAGFGQGIQISGGSTGNVVAGNWIGPGADGQVVGDEETGHGNKIAVRLRDGAVGNLIGTNADGVSDALERNVISGNLGIPGFRYRGVLISDPETEANVIAGNFIGLAAGGNRRLANSLGIEIDRGARRNVIGTNGDGLGDAFEGNVISGHAGDCGICLYDEGTVGNRISGNRIGTDASGTRPLGNESGVMIGELAGPTIVGTNGDGVSDELEGNLISGQTGGVAIDIFGGFTDPDDEEEEPEPLTTTGHTIAGNWIGLAADGRTRLGNGEGVRLRGGSVDVVVGFDGDGDPAVERNVIAGTSGTAVKVAAGDGFVPAGVVVRGNWLGLDADGQQAVSNRVGIEIERGEVVVRENRIEGSTVAGIVLRGTGTFAAADVTSQDGVSRDNCLRGNREGVSREGFILGTAASPFEDNYWGSRSGPGGVGPGLGDPVTVGVDFLPFLAEAPPSCGAAPRDRLDDGNGDLDTKGTPGAGPAEIPTLGEWGMILLAALLAFVAVGTLGRMRGSA